MVITFFIGNGFDLNLGMKTEYKDFYPYFLEHGPKNNIIRESIQKNTELWSDLERQLGIETKAIDASKTAKYIGDKGDLVKHLADYLAEQEKRLTENDVINCEREMKRSLQQFHFGLQPLNKEAIQSALEVDRDNTWEYNFISFNYTRTFDRLLNARKGTAIGTHVNRIGNNRNNIMGEIIHIHGTTEEGMILGVNDEDQLANEDLRYNPDFNGLMIKRELNYNSGYNREKRARDIIGKSHIIIVYGMSLGETDRNWWQEIIEWLANNSQRQLIICRHKADANELKVSPEKRIASDATVINEFVYYAPKGMNKETLEGIKERVHITYDPKIFNFKMIGNQQ